MPDISKLNVGVTGNTTGFDKAADHVEDRADKLATKIEQLAPSTNGIDAAAADAGVALGKVDTAINKSIAQLYKLRSEGAKGFIDPKQALAQIEQIKKQLADGTQLNVKSNRADQIVEASKTSREQFASELREIQTLRREKLLTAEQAAKAEAKARDRYGDKLKKPEQVAKDTQAAEAAKLAKQAAEEQRKASAQAAADAEKAAASRAAEINQARAARQAEAKRVSDDVKTPRQKYAEELRNLRSLKREQLLTADQVAKAGAKAREKYGDKLRRTPQGNEPAQGKLGAFAGEATKKAFEALGLGLGEKAAGALGTAGIVAAVAAAATKAAVANKTDARESGVSRGTLGGKAFTGAGFIGGLQSLPVVSQIHDLVQEAGSSLVSSIGDGLSFLGATKVGGAISGFGGDLSPSKQLAEQERLTEAAAAYEKYRRLARDVAKENALIDRGNAQTLAQMSANADAARNGGKAGQIAAVDAGLLSTLTALENARDDGKAQAQRNANDLVAGFDADITKNKKIQGANLGKESDDAKAEVDRLTAARQAVLDLLKEQQAKFDEGYVAQSKFAKAEAGDQKAIIAGSLPNLKAIDDAMLSLSDTIDTMGVDQFDAMAKAFAKFNPSTEQMKAFNEQIDAYRQKTAELSVAQLEKSVDVAGLDDKEAILKRMELDGIRGETIVKMRVALETADARAKAKALKDELKNITVQIAVAGAGNDPLKKIDAEFEAEQKQIDAQRKKALGDPKLKPEDRSKLQKEYEAEDAQRNEVRAAKKRLVTTQEGSDIKESVKSDGEKLADEIAKIRRNVEAGSIDDETARKAIEKSRNDFLDTQKTSNPAMLEAGSGAAQRAAYITAGKVQDSNNPLLREAKKTNDILTEIKGGQKSDSEIALNI